MKSTNAIHGHVHSRGGVGGKSDLIFIYGSIEANAGILNPLLPTTFLKDLEKLEML